MALEPAGSTPASRVPSIDWLRGAAMVLMALDHVRYFFSSVPFAPENMEKTWLALFMTRWVTHFCAPLFFFLAGASARLRGRRDPHIRRYLITRGLILIALELTVIGFGWNFTPGYSFAGVIWALGWSMIILALFVSVPPLLTALFSAGIIALHDLASGLDPAALGAFQPLWRLMHVPGGVRIGSFDWYVLYPLVPWFAVMTLGYAAGALFTKPAARRNPLLLLSGGAATVLFVLLRVGNAYGNPPGSGSGRLPFAVYPAWSGTLISLLNVCKYPPSLQYLLMTIGPSLIALSLLDRQLRSDGGGVVSAGLVALGRVPMFFYVAHLYLIHLLAFVLAMVSGQPWRWLGWNGDQSVVPPPGYGYGLVIVYAVWFGVLAILYPACLAWSGFKRTGGRAFRPMAKPRLTGE